MASLTNIRLHTTTKVVPDVESIALVSVAVSNGTLVVADAEDVQYVLGVVTADDYAIPTPLEPQCPCGENTSNSNVLATLLKGVDGITPDMSDYYDKGVVEEKLAKKQDVITDLATIRSNASKGATALQSVPSEYVTESELSAKGYATTSQVSTKQDKISDLDTIRSGAAKGATALQSETYKGTVTGVKVNGSTKSPSNGIVDIGTVITSHQDISGKQDKIADLEAIRSGAAKGATALQEHQPLKTINGESVVGSGNIAIEGGGGGVTEEYVDNAIAEVNVKGEDGYVYSNGEKVDMRIMRSLIPVGTPIPASANLNTIAYLKVGNYYCSQTANAKTITNCPVEVAFSMEVFNPLSETLDDETTAQNTYRIRKITAYNTGVQYMQYCNTSGTAGTWTYGSWFVVPRTSFSLTSDKNGGSAAKGASNRGVYIDASGTFQQMSYTIAKSVPSNAVFTDTNTKVTSVDNHYAPAEDEGVVLSAPDGEVVVGLKRDAAGHVVGVTTTPMSGGGSGGGEGALTEAQITAMGFTKNEGTITEVKMNGVSKGTSGVVDLGNVITDISGKQDVITDLATIREGASKGSTAVQPSSLSSVATSGSYNDLSDKPTIPSAVTERVVSSWGFTKNTGTYSKPSGGIPKSDLASDVQTSLGKTDTALQTYIVDFDFFDLISGKDFSANTQAFTDAVRKEKLILVPYYKHDSVTGYIPMSAYIEDCTNFSIQFENKIVIGACWTDVAEIFAADIEIINVQDKLVSGINIKTINGQSILGSGNITIEGGGSSGGGGKKYVVVVPDLSPMGAEIYIKNIEPNKTYIVSEPIALLHINGFGTPEAVCDEYNVIFKGDTGGVTLTIEGVDYLLWANGTIPTMEETAVYELSIQRVRISGYDMYNVVVTPFKLIE